MVEETADVGATLDAFSSVVIAGRPRARADRPRDAPPPPLHPVGGARVPDLGRDGAHRGERAGPARHPGRCRHVPPVSGGADPGPRRRLRGPAVRGGHGRGPDAGAARHPRRPRRRREVPRPEAARPRRRRADGGQRGRPGDPRTGPAGGHAGPGPRPDDRPRLAEAGAGAALRPQCLGRGDGLPQRRSAGDDHHALLRSEPVQLRRVAGAMGGMDQQPPCAADQQGDVRRVSARLHVQDGGRDGRAGQQGDRPGRPHQLPGLSRCRRHAVPLLEQVRPRLAGRAGRAEELLRRVLLRIGAAGRHRPAVRHGQPVRHRRRPGHRTARFRARG